MTGQYGAPTQYGSPNGIPQQPYLQGGSPQMDEMLFEDPSYQPILQSNGSAPNFEIRLDTPTMMHMLDFQNNQGNKELTLLNSQAQQDGFPTLVLGAQFRGSGLVGHTNTAEKFPYLGRFPTDFTGTSATDLRLLQANQAIAAHATDWASGYVETLFSDVFSFRDFKQGSFQVRQAYVVIGDLDRSPFYGYIGKKNIAFGNFETLSPFTQAVPWHYFAPIAEGAGVGFSSGGLHLTATALSGSRGIRVTDSSDKGSVNNYAFNGSYTFSLGDESYITLGGGYLNGTIYNSTTAEHLDPSIFGPNNGAWDVNGSAQFGPVKLAAEYLETLEIWPATGHQVQAWKAETALDTGVYGLPWYFSASYSSGIQGSSTDEFEFNNQLVLGSKYSLSENVQFTLEYVRSSGFAPLINIATVSDKDVVQDSFVFGVVVGI